MYKNSHFLFFCFCDFFLNKSLRHKFIVVLISSVIIIDSSFFLIYYFSISAIVYQCSYWVQSKETGFSSLMA